MLGALLELGEPGQRIPGRLRIHRNGHAAHEAGFPGPVQDSWPILVEGGERQVAVRVDQEKA